MIAEVFLCAAISAPPAFSMHSLVKPVAAMQTVELMREALEHYPRRHSRLGMEAEIVVLERFIKGRVLLIGGDPIFTRNLRQVGVKAFGAYSEDYSGLTRWHAVTDVGQLAFKDSAFDAVFWHHIGQEPGLMMQWLVDATMLVAPSGFFLFDESQIHLQHWAVYLLAQGWHKVLHHDKSMQLSIYQRPAKKIARPAYDHFVPRVLSFPVPKWKMRWGRSTDSPATRAIETSA